VGTPPLIPPPMQHLSSRLLGTFAGAILLATSAGACAKSDAKPLPAPATAAATSPAAPSLSGLTDSISAMADRGRIRGAESAPVWLIEISDFQCPYCKRWHDEVFAIVDKEYVQTG